MVWIAADDLLLWQILEAAFGRLAQNVTLELDNTVDDTTDARAQEKPSHFGKKRQLGETSHYSVSMWSDVLNMKQRNLKTGFVRDIRRSGVSEIVRSSHWLEIELPSLARVTAFGFRCTSSAKVCSSSKQTLQNKWCVCVVPHKCSVQLEA